MIDGSGFSLVGGEKWMLVFLSENGAVDAIGKYGSKGDFSSTFIVFLDLEMHCEQFGILIPRFGQHSVQGCVDILAD